ncbi:hypothetical protein [Asticcacaulis sp. AC402]|uniref:hypothetical protein n=1 Tax=Asticcacaulis sp. AC402 TaxID=1282361 RepID=UPI0003C406A2|nr:hypothetical protein [Asticcacaulis sp. AC402]ESQ74523.1 hypothetical protein ABAC402_13630 [Asticcacaulis sp. AC402]
MGLNRCFRALVAAYLLAFLPAAVLAAPQTERVYLSGKGPKDAVAWEFSVTGGRRAGEQTTIPVPSMWEQHGFGTYNYGNEGEAREHGHYKRRFSAPADWKGKRVRLVFTFPAK